MPTVSEYIQYRWLPRTARGIDVVSRKIIPVVADALATFGVSSVVAAKAIGEQGWTGLSNKWHFARKCTLFFNEKCSHYTLWEDSSTNSKSKRPVLEC